MYTLRAFFIIAILLIIGGGLFVWSGIYNIAASEPHWMITSEVLEVLRERSIDEHAEKLVAPDTVPLPALANAASDYAEMCAQCHLAPGMAPTALNQGLYPQPPILHKTTGDEDIREVFWVIKNGIKLTGMPAWGKVHSDQEIWALAQFVRYLPKMKPQQYRELTGLSVMPAGAGHTH